MQNFSEFWPFYLKEHSNRTNRWLHFIGTLLVHILFIAIVVCKAWVWLWLVPVAGYSFAWVGHYIVEKNRPATFTYPLWSLIADFKMFYQMLAGKNW